ncbi:MAG: hypothetical protein ACRCU2_06525 [Planktothrix sp.]
MTLSEDIKQILCRIEGGQQTSEDINYLHQRLIAGDHQATSQLGKYNVNIGEGKELHIGDRIYSEWNQDTIKALIQALMQDKSDPHKDIIWKNLIDIRFFIQHGFVEQVGRSSTLDGKDLMIHDVCKVFENEKPYISRDVYDYFWAKVVPDLEKGFNGLLDILREWISFKNQHNHSQDESEYVTRFDLLLNKIYEIYKKHLDHLQQLLFS